MIKKVTSKEELEKVHALASYAFNIKHSEEEKEAYLEKNNHMVNYVDEVEGDISSQVLCYPFEVMLHGKKLTMAGIGDVATYPEARGTGSVRQLFETILKELHDNGTVLSYLAPFSQIFYRKFGYENLMTKEEVRIPKSLMDQINPELSGQVKRVTWTEETTKETLKRLYKETLGQESGTLVRPDYWWEYNFIPSTNKHIAIAYNEAKEAVGYLVYELIGHKEFLIKELAYLDNKALKQLLTFVSSHKGSFSDFVFLNMSDEMMLSHFTETQEMIRKIDSGMMGRIVSFETLIENYPFTKYSTETVLYLEVQDSTCEWNHGCFKVIITEGKGSCEKQMVAATPDYSGTVQEWLPVFMGVHTLNQAVAYDLIEKNSEEEMLSELIPSGAPSLYDYF